MQGVAGEWEVVSPPADPSTTLSDGEAIREEESRKREAEAPSEDDERVFKLRRKTLGAGLGEIYDPGIIPIKLKAKKEDQSVEPDVTASSNSASNSTSTASEEVSKATTTLPKWTKIQWKKMDDVAETGKSEKAEDDHDAVGLVLNDTTEAEMQENTTLKLEDTPTSETPLPSSGGGSLFKKRRTPGNRVIH
jgi:WW domain-binding protein 4